MEMNKIYQSKLYAAGGRRFQILHRTFCYI